MEDLLEQGDPGQAAKAAAEMLTAMAAEQGVGPSTGPELAARGTVEVLTEDTSCQLCGRKDMEEDMDLCDHCNKGYHRQCLALGDRRPEDHQGFWYCMGCRADEDTLDSCDPAEDLALHEYLQTGQMPLGCRAQEKARLRSRCQSYEMDRQGRLYKLPTGDYERRRVVPVAEREEKLNWHHNEIGHPGADTMYETLRRLYWWPQMAADCRAYVDRCRHCLMHKPLPRTYVPMKPSPLGVFMERWAIDSSGRLNKTANNNEYLIIAMDAYSKWPEAVAVPKLDSQATADFFKREVIYRYGPPASVTHDNGPEYQLHFQDLLRKHGIKSKPSPAMLPACNGLAEKTVKTVKERLAKAGGPEAHLKWDEELPAVLYGMRSAAQSTTQYPPYRVLFGRGAPSLSGRQPKDTKSASAGEDSEADEEATTGLEQEVAARAASNAELHKRMQGNVKVAQARQAKGYVERNRHRREAKKVLMGQKVYVRNQEKGKKGQLRAKALGPFLVVEVSGDMVYVRGGTCPDGAKREWAEHLSNVAVDQGEWDGSEEEQG
jgi:hypothetical protein